MNFEIPPGLTDLLQEFTVAVLRTRPSNLEAFAADYFNNLNEKKNGPLKLSGALRFQENDTVNIIEPSDGHGSSNEDDDDDSFVGPPSSYRDRRKSVSAERYDPEADDEGDYTKVVNPKSDEQRRRLNDAIKHILLFRSLDHEQMQEVLDAMFEKIVDPGEEIIAQGDDGDNFYLIDDGKYDIYVNIDGKRKLVGNYNNEGFFGELALMYNMPRAATIIAASRGTIWGLDRQTFRRIVLKTAFNKRKKYEKLIEGVPMLSSLDMYERMNVCDALSSQTFRDGQQIIAQGDKADCMYFVEEGNARVAMVNKADPTATVEKEISRVGPGGYFGELALVTNKPRAASVYSVGVTKLAVLDVHAFERLMGPCMDIMKRNIGHYESQLLHIFGDKANISDLR
ncbi:PKA type II regulatory subunit [Aplysia californica]|uniref:cAMP-dependent protein kinase type II regulatory subunit n=1 Tax=Aplysia californica TaxID=6500 RepID=Q6TU32_APLCA|nr:PKA type II regulatory subunit [Aplysia californica]AAR26367.1 PKA type II regulatory subunit [Aplysia californica]